jgi:hypothetical protein
MADQLHSLKYRENAGCSRALTFAEIHFKTIETLEFGLLPNPQF